MTQTDKTARWPFSTRPICIGVVHLPALPGSPQSIQSIEEIRPRAVDEARMLSDAGFDGVVVENFGDTPFHADFVEPHTIAAMAIIVSDICRTVSVPVGVNVLRNDARGALAVASMGGAKFVRVNVHTGVYATDQGLIEGRAAQTLRYRRTLMSEVAIFADVHVKHATPIGQRDLALAAEETAHRGLADALIVTGPTTARAASLDDLRQVKSAVADRPVLVGSGVTPASLAGFLSQADGVIVGSWLKQGGVTTNPIDPKRLAKFAKAMRR